MKRYVVRRVIMAVPVLLLISILNFGMMHIAGAGTGWPPQCRECVMDESVPQDTGTFWEEPDRWHVAFGQLERFVDEAAGVVCYIYFNHNHDAVAVSCLPISQTRLK